MIMRSIRNPHPSILHADIHPISDRFGFDRGTPIDRYWIDNFIRKNEKYIYGSVLEIGDNRYTKQYGHAVKRTDILDMSNSNRKATIIGDLRNLKKTIKSHSYDCVILTHVIGIIDDYRSALLEAYRILKPGGSLLITVASLCPTVNGNMSYWRFTPASMHYTVKTLFPLASLSVESYGNVASGIWFWEGLCVEEVAQEVLDIHDKRYVCMVSAVITKN